MSVKPTMRVISVYCTLFVPLAFLVQSHPSVPMIECRLSVKKPLIDGILDEACWKEADVVSGFSLLHRKGRARQQTEAMVSYDAEHLYIAFVCLESLKRAKRPTIVARDAPVWRDDCVEVFLDPRHDHTSYFHLITNLNGARFDEQGRIGVPVPNPKSWDAEWTVATALFDGGWTVEVAVPFRSMVLSTPIAGTIWGLNVHRQDYRLFERSSWCETDRWFHEPKNFGHLLFVPSL